MLYFYAFTFAVFLRIFYDRYGKSFYIVLFHFIFDLLIIFVVMINVKKIELTNATKSVKYFFLLKILFTN